MAMLIVRDDDDDDDIDVSFTGGGGGEGGGRRFSCTSALNSIINSPLDIENLLRNSPSKEPGRRADQEILHD